MDLWISIRSIRLDRGVGVFTSSEIKKSYLSYFRERDAVYSTLSINGLKNK